MYLFIPFLQRYDILGLNFANCTILMQAGAYNLSHCLGHLINSRDQPRMNYHNSSLVTVCDLKTLANEKQIVKFIPQGFSNFNIKRIGVFLAIFGHPIASEFVFANDSALEYLLLWIVVLVMSIFSHHLVFVDVINLGPGYAVIKVYTVDSIFLNNLGSLGNQQIPGIQLTIVQHHCIFVIDWPPLTTIERMFLSPLIHIKQPEWFIAFVVTTRADSGGTVSNHLHTLFMWFTHKLFEFFLAT